VARVPAGEAFEQRQLDELARATRAASDQSGLRFSVFVGRSEGDSTTYAERLLAAMGPDADNGVLVHVDPDVRCVEVVTGRSASRRLDDRACGLAALSMTSSFAGGDLVGGIVIGLRMLGDSVAA
jgi:hypothetical protein